MNPDEAVAFPAVNVALKDGRSATLRLLGRTDGEALAAFYAAVPPDDVRFYCPHPLTKPEALKKAASADDSRFVCLVGVAEKGDIAGYAWYRWQADDSPSSGFGICIRRDFQGSGLARALMADLLKIAARVGPPVMHLTVQKANPRAVALYRKMGFTVVREQVRDFDNEPEYCMERKVKVRRQGLGRAQVSPEMSRRRRS